MDVANVYGYGASEMESTNSNSINYMCDDTTGITFDGVDDYLSLDNVEQGGTLTLTFLVRYEEYEVCGDNVDCPYGDVKGDKFMAMYISSIETDGDGNELSDNSYDIDLISPDMVIPAGS
jgi:hypothetical protein